MTSILKGIYTLLTKLDASQAITIGKRGIISFPAGYYVYVGSALNGIEVRVARHLKKEKPLHWHIDYFLQKAQVKEIIAGSTEKKMECTIASHIGRKLTPVPHFGCSDCRCTGHLYFCKNRRVLRSVVRDCFKECGIRATLIRVEHQKSLAGSTVRHLHQILQKSFSAKFTEADRYLR